MSKMGALALALVAVCAPGIATTAAASAAGIYWYAEGHRLEAGENVNTTGSNQIPEAVGSFKFVNTPQTIECTKLSDSVTLKGGTPGTDKHTITLSECTVPEHAGCTVESEGAGAGTVVLKATSELVFRTANEAEKEEVAESTIAMLVIGEGESETLATLVFSEKHCTVAGSTKLHGSVAAKLKPPGEAGEWDTVEFPAPSVKTVFRAKSSTEIKPMMFIFGTLYTVIPDGKEIMDLK